MMKKILTYSELVLLPTFQERIKYLKLEGVIGEETFGFERYLNQKFYTSSLWRSIRNSVIIRDEGRDLGVKGYDISGKIIIHHLNPITIDDVLQMSDVVINPEFLITLSDKTHNYIHFGIENPHPIMVERKPNDTCPWRKN